MEARCKKCGKPLHDPVSVARGMGPKCAGIVNTRKGFRSSQGVLKGTVYPAMTENHATINLFSMIEEREDKVSDILKQFPTDLVDLVLSAPTTGSIASRVKLYSHRKHSENDVHPITLLKQIRHMCIEIRLFFWPGLSTNLKPIPCIPYGDNDWQIGENGRVLSKEELVSYLSRYGIIGQKPAEKP